MRLLLRVVLGLALALASLVLVPATASAATATISSAQVDVVVDTAFPRVLSYTWKANGATLGGQDQNLTKVKVNGSTYTPTVSSTVGAAGVDYSMVISALDLTVAARIEVAAELVTFKVTGFSGPGAAAVDTFAVPDHSLVSVRADQAGARVSSAAIQRTNYNAPEADTYSTVSSADVDASPKSTNYAFVGNDGVVAAVQSSSITTYGPLQLQTTQPPSGVKRTGVWSNTFTYRGPDDGVVALPEVQVVLSGDRNSDSVVDWQDGAIAFRGIMTRPYGHEKVADHVVQMISMNFASQNQRPFIRALDDIKKSYLYTDGLGQAVQFKGYAGEGHDSAHPDYAGHYNHKAGGLTDMQFAMDAAENFNADVGVHIQNYAQLLESKAFRWDKSPANKTAYYYFYGDGQFPFDVEKDLVSGDHLQRLENMAAEATQNKFVYNDVTFHEDWSAWKTAKNITSQGWPLYTEFPTYMWPYVTWYHQSAEYDAVGINSDIIRFLYNGDSDAWVRTDNPLLFGVDSAGFTGWQGQRDVNYWIKKVFTQNLPTKYLQHFQMQKQTATQIDFTGNVVSQKSGKSGNTVISKDGHVIADGANYFIPWDPENPTKVYHWNSAGGNTTRYVPTTWAQNGTVKLYKLTDTGRQFVRDLKVSGGQVTVRATKNTPYVLYPTTPAAVPDVNYGDGTAVKDGEFYSKTFDHWTRSSSTGNTSGITIPTDQYGFQSVQMAGKQNGAVSQTVTSLAPGTYTASAWVSTTANRPATLSVSGYGGATVANTITKTPPPDADLDHHLSGTNSQAIRAVFTVASTSNATIKLDAAAAGSGTVNFSDVRIMRTDDRHPTAGGHTYSQDFEDVDQGWDPFVLAQETEPSVHLSERHENYTRDTISGNYSLKATNGTAGLVYRTWPGTLPLKAGRTYRVRLDYSADTPLYSFQVKADGVTNPIAKADLLQTTDRAFDSAPPATDPVPPGWDDVLPPQGSAPSAVWEHTFTAGSCGDAYLGLVQAADKTSAGAVIDNLTVDDLGPAATGEGCKDLANLSGPTTLLRAGTSTVLPITFTNTSTQTLTNVTVTPTVPAGWSVSPASATIASVASGASVSPKFTLTPPSGATGQVNVKARATYTYNGVQGAVSQALVTPVIAGDRLPQSLMSVKFTDSQNSASEAATNVLDGNPATNWVTKWSPSADPLPHEVQLDLGASYAVSKLYYLPRPDGPNGRIANYEVYLSSDGTTWGTAVATGTFPNNATEQTVTFTPKQARYIRLRATSEVNGNPWSSAAELNVGINP